MRTEDLVTMLAKGAGVVQPNQAARRYAAAIAWGASGAALLMVILLRPRPDLAAAMLLPMFWVKIAFVTSFAAASLLAALRLSRPGLSLAWVPGALFAPLLAIWLLATIVLARADAAQRAGLHHLAGKRTSNLLLYPFSTLDKHVEVDFRLNAHSVQHVNQIFRGNIARGPWRKRTAAEPADG